MSDQLTEQNAQQSSGTRSAIYAGEYRLTGLQRVGSDLYRSFENVFVETKYCGAIPVYDDAILSWKGNYGYSALFVDGQECTVRDAWQSR